MLCLKISFCKFVDYFSTSWYSFLNLCMSSINLKFLIMFWKVCSSLIFIISGKISICFLINFAFLSFSFSMFDIRSAVNLNMSDPLTVVNWFIFRLFFLPSLLKRILIDYSTWKSCKNLISKDITVLAGKRSTWKFLDRCKRKVHFERQKIK